MIIMHRKLNMDDLIVMYLIMKIKSGRDNSVSEDELLDFIEFFNYKKKIYDEKPSFKYMMEHLYNKKQKLWRSNPHILLDRGAISATYDLTSNDVRNSDLNCLTDFEIIEIKKIIFEYLSKIPMRVLDTSVDINEDILNVSNDFSALMCQTIWNSYIHKYMDMGEWPKQCDDIEKYLFKLDLANIIDIPSIREELIIFYEQFSRRFASLLSNSGEIVINSNPNYYLANHNYNLCIMGFYGLMDYMFNKEIELVVKNKKKKYSNANSIENNFASNLEVKKLVKRFNEYM